MASHSIKSSILRLPASYKVVVGATVEPEGKATFPNVSEINVQLPAKLSRQP